MPVKTLKGHPDGRLADALQEVNGLTVTFPPTLTPHAQRLLATLGITVHYSPEAPGICCTVRKPGTERKR